MIDLSNITLFTVMGNPKPSAKENNDIINRIIKASCSKIKFGAIKVVSAQKDLIFDSDVEVTYVDGFDLRGYNKFMIQELNQFVDTDFVLTFQNDGFILNPEKWDSDFLNYDWIGAPWPNDLKSRVGNGGFSLRSKKMLEFCENMEYVDNVGLNPNSNCTPEDHLICRENYEKCLDAGLKFAPISLAKKFSYEMPIDDDRTFNPLNTFGFHGVFQNGLEKDPFRVLVKKLFFDQL